MSKTNLPESLSTADVVQMAVPTSAGAGALTVFEPPTFFEVVDRGPASVVNFNHHGDSFVGVYEYTEEMVDDEGEKFPMAVFTGADAKPYCFFPGKSLQRGLRKVNVGQWARITYVADVDTGKPSPMKAFIVEVARQEKPEPVPDPRAYSDDNPF